jgi:beta-lactam-binding protein with PASTA domain
MTSSFEGTLPEQPEEVLASDAATGDAVTPDLIGLALYDACEAAAWAGTRLDATSVARAHGPWGVVVAQSPSPGVRLRSLWQIHVLVSTPLPADDGEDA